MASIPNDRSDAAINEAALGRAVTLDSRAWIRWLLIGLVVRYVGIIILAPLGAGGMGLAILASDATLRSRFCPRTWRTTCA